MKEFKEFLNEDKQPEVLAENMKAEMQIAVINAMIDMSSEKDQLKILSDAIDSMVEEKGEEWTKKEFKDLKKTKISSTTYKKLERYLKNQHLIDL